MLLSCPRQESNQRMRLKEALSSALPRRKTPSLRIHPSRTRHLRSTLTGKTCYLVAALHLADCSTLVRSADFALYLPFVQKIGTFFGETGCRLSCSSAIVSARRGFLKGAALCAGAHSLSAL